MAFLSGIVWMDGWMDGETGYDQRWENILLVNNNVYLQRM